VTAVAAAWDLVARAWLVLVAWYGLRRPARLRYLGSTGHPLRLIRGAIVPAGRHFALALAFLPRQRRLEASLVFLICKALDAFEDLSVDRAAARAGVTAAADYLTGRSARPPRGDGLRATRESDRLEALLAARLPLFRVALEAMPAPAAQRSRALIDRIADGMVRQSPDRRRYADDVLGAAVAYAAEVAAPGEPPPAIACRAAGRALQLANDMRDAATERDRAIALYQALPELPLVPRLLRWLAAGAGRGTRAAATLVVVTTCAFYLRHIDHPVPPRLRHPIRAALAAAWSRRAYLATVAALEHVLRDALAQAAGLGSTPRGLDPELPDGTSDPVASAATLVALAMDLVHAVPTGRLDAATPEPPGKAIAIADYLLFAAVDRLTDTGPATITRVAELLEQLAAPADTAALARSTALTELAAEVG